MAKERTPHKLKKKRLKRLKDHINLFVDVESNIDRYVDNDGMKYQQQTFKIAYIIDDNNDEFYVDSLESFYAIIGGYSSEYSNVTVWAHNMRGYDSLVLRIYTQVWKHLYYKLDNIYHEGSYFAIFKKGDNQIRFVDSLNIFKGSLEQLGIDFDVKTKKKAIDFSSDVADNDLIERCRTDTIILRDIIHTYFKFLKKNKLGTQKMTIASQTMESFLTTFYDPKVNEIYIHTKQWVIDMERNSYCGGRTEAFRIGNFINIYVLDVNSMYPFAMVDKKYPISFYCYSKNYNISEIYALCKNDKFCVVSKVMLKIPDGISAVPKKVNGKLLFLSGEFSVDLCTPELIYCIEKGYVTSVLETSVYNASSTLFNEYVEFFFDIKKNATTKAWEIMAKLFLNSFYGKWGQLVGGWENVQECNPEIFKEWQEIKDLGNGRHESIKYRAVGGMVQKRCKDHEKQESFNSFCAIASHVTSYSRMILQNAFDIVGDEKYYCDTDSVFTTEHGYNKLKELGFVGKELGQFKLEKVYATLEIKGLKDYSGVIKDVEQKDGTFKDVTQTKIKGVRKKDKEVERNKYLSERWDSLHGQLSRGNDEYFLISEFYKELTREYNKGKVDGDTVIPFTMKGGEIELI